MTSQPSQQKSPSLGIDQLLTLALNGLDQYFFKAHKEKARKLYKEIADGSTTEFVSITFKGQEDKPVKFKLKLDHSEYKGHLTFHMFKLALQQMMKNIAAKLKAKQQLNVMTSENGEVLVNLPGVIQDRDNINILVIGVEPGKSTAIFKLQFLDADQFKKEPSNDDQAAAE